ncbi:MAG: hypothetical protein M1827_000459 [Pycnora praestabilis]|nr:MAG: hypothetical protein M1827_000459 [Pycnora praestabilis]
MSGIVEGLSGSVQGLAGGVLNKGQGYLDKWFPPEKREELTTRISKFAAEKPALASFLLSHIALSGIPIGLFVVFTLGILVFALVAGLVIAVLAALIFSALCVGFALLILLPVLFITTFAAVFVWLWGVGAYYLLKWFNKEEIPGITKGSNNKSTEKSEIPGEQQNGQARHIEGEKKEHKKDGKANGAPKLNGVGDVTKKVDVNDVTKKATDVAGDPKKAAEIGNVTNTVGDVGEVGDVGKTTGGVTDKVGSATGGKVPGIGAAKGLTGL